MRFSFIASIHVERPRASNDRQKMEVPRYRAPRSVCLAEIAPGLDLSDVGSGWSVPERKGCQCRRRHSDQSHRRSTDVSAGGRRACICFHVRGGMWSRNWSSWAGPTLRTATLVFWHRVLIMLYCVGVSLKLISFNNFLHKSFTTASNIKTASMNWYFLL